MAAGHHRRTVGGTHPFLISWDGGTSPADDSPLGGRFTTLRGGDPDADTRAAVLASLGLDVAVEAAAAEWLTATVETPSGTITLG